ncbi:DNA-directed RNA polymerase subunit beta [SAR202 cluster bacterium AC-647-N09_OGT_505m]|nr:DNA-directed RNA polymerase subunit beta [SAR202 cluster bacterium AC-647-N09_OGT_505m]
MASLAVNPTQNIGTYIPQKSYAKIPEVLDVPNLIQLQIASFKWFMGDCLSSLFQEVSPIKDFTGGRFELSFLDHEFQEPKYSEEECRAREITYAAPLYITARLDIMETGERAQQRVFIGDIPMMSSQGTFIINGAERVVVSQLVRSPGVYLTLERDVASDRNLCSGKLIPYRGAWLEFETSNKDVLSVKVDRKRKAPITTLLRALGLVSEEELLTLFQDVDNDPQHQYMKSTLERDTQVRDQDEALLEFYRRLRPGEPPNVENARNLMENLFFNPRRYDLGRVGRHKLNRRLGLDLGTDRQNLTKEDLIAVVRLMIQINNGQANSDDIDHLGNRRIRAVGELLQNQLRVGFLRMERVIRERMTTQPDPSAVTAASLINVRPVVAAVREFFGGSQLSQFMDQTNPLAELTHKRRLSALGPGGLSRERAGFDVRDVHHSHYGRICPIETPEGPNIGLLGSLATYARTNDFGFIETPYRRILWEVPNTYPGLQGHIITEAVVDDQGKVVARKGQLVSAAGAKRLAVLPPCTIKVKPFASADPNDIVYLAADEEELYPIAQANSPLDKKNQFVTDRVEVRRGEVFSLEPPENVSYMDISPIQIVSVSAALIPFLEHDDANRALMGSNMQRQAVPLVRTEAPLVGTGMEWRVAMDSGQVVISRTSGVVTSVSGNAIEITDVDGNKHRYPLRKFLRSNQGTCITQRSIVTKGDVVKAGQPLADSSSTDNGELALGQNVLVAFMSWEGFNFEDAIIVNEDLLRKDKFTSIHIEKYEVEARDTKLGAEEITRDISNVGEDGLRNLDEYGVIYPGAEVGPGDILVGKITPKGETELTAEEKLLRAIFGEKARDVKDTSLKVPHGERGKVIDVKVLSRANKEELPPGVNTLVRVWIAQTRKIAEGDKMAGRHGNKGVISRVLPSADMPYLADGTPMDIILNPIGVPSRMNLGQLLETHLGMAAHGLGIRVVSPVFDGAEDISIEDALARAWMIDQSGAKETNSENDNTHIDMKIVEGWLTQQGYDPEKVLSDAHPGEARNACLKIWLTGEAGVDIKEMSDEDMFRVAIRLSKETGKSAPILGKSILYDGLSGEPFYQPITVGYIYMMKLIHLVEDKIHARSTGPYSLITQQPLGGKAQFGGQRFGEMEVWALEAYSAAYNLQEMLTVKSDDVIGRVKTYEAIVKGEDVVQPGVPESFHVLVKELQSLGLSVDLLHDEDGQPMLQDITEPITVEGEIIADLDLELGLDLDLDLDLGLGLGIDEVEVTDETDGLEDAPNHGI